MANSAAQTVFFAAAVCVVCASVVSSSAVLLHTRQQRNAALDRQRNVLAAAGLVEPGAPLHADTVRARFEGITPTTVDLRTGVVLSAEATTKTVAVRSVSPNAARVAAVPEHAIVYELRDDDDSLRMVVLPVEGKGLWSTMRGFLCLEADMTTICGLSFYDHAETPGLGAEIDNPRWKARWVGRRAFDDAGRVRIEVAKGPAGPVEADPFRVDGISGATITSRGVTHLLRFWLSDEGYGPYLDRLGEER